MRSILRVIAATGLVLVITGCQPSVPPPNPGPSLITLTVPVPVGTADKTVIAAAVEVLSARLRALGIEDFSSSAGAGLVFQLSVADPSIQPAAAAALGARGIVEFLRGGGEPLQEGSPAPDAAPIFDASTQIESATLGEDQNGSQVVDIVLGPDGTKAMADYTTEHIGQYMILALDGRVLAQPVIQSAMLDGKIQLSFPAEGVLPPAAIAAIMAAGPMPPGWAAP
jgi:hypothetical protein